MKSFQNSSNIFRKHSDWLVRSWDQPEPITVAREQNPPGTSPRSRSGAWDTRPCVFLASLYKGGMIPERKRCCWTDKTFEWPHYEFFNIFKNSCSKTLNLLTEQRQYAYSETLYNEAYVLISWESSNGPCQHTEWQFALPVCSVINIMCFSSLLRLHISNF